MQTKHIKIGNTEKDKAKLKEIINSIKELQTDPNASGVVWILNKVKIDKRLDVDMATGMFVLRNMSTMKLLQAFYKTINVEPEELIDLLKAEIVMKKMDEGSKCPCGENHSK